jgi:hypothetical protein
MRKNGYINYLYPLNRLYYPLTAMNQDTMKPAAYLKKQVIEVLLSILIVVFVIFVFAAISFIPSTALSINVKDYQLPLSIFFFLAIYKMVHCTYKETPRNQSK